MRGFLVRLVSASAIFVLVRAFFQALHLEGYYPENTLAQMMVGAVNLAHDPTTAWVVSAVVAVPFLFVNRWGPRLGDAASHLIPRRFHRTVPLWSAALEIYERLEGFAIVEHVDEIYPTAEGRAGYFVSAFLRRKFPLAGKKPPSTQLRRIPEDDMPLLDAIRGTSDLVFRPPALRGPGYREVRIRRSDINKYIRYAKRLSKTLL